MVKVPLHIKLTWKLARNSPGRDVNAVPVFFMTVWVPSRGYFHWSPGYFPENQRSSTFNQSTYWDAYSGSINDTLG
jgi:hypothetical protein